jgi:hypothetical protein
MCKDKCCSVEEIEECKRADACRVCPTRVVGECTGCIHLRTEDTDGSGIMEGEKDESI